MYNDEGIVDCGFAILFQRELGPEWTLADHRGNLHVVTYNVDLHFPMIIEGWVELLSFMALKENITLCFVTLAKIVSI